MSMAFLLRPVLHLFLLHHAAPAVAFSVRGGVVQDSRIARVMAEDDADTTTELSPHYTVDWGGEMVSEMVMEESSVAALPAKPTNLNPK